MKRQELSKRDVIQGFLLIVALLFLLSVAGTSDLESTQALSKEVARFQVAR